MFLESSVPYTPATANSSPPIPFDQLHGQGISYIRLQWVDLVNIVRYRVIPLAYFEKLLKSPRPGVGVAKAAMGLVYLMAADGFSPMGEYLYAPDMSTLRVCPYAPGHASVMGWFQERTPIAVMNGPPTVEVDLCPRTILRRVVEHAKMTSDVEFLVGFETEFILLKSIEPIEAVNIHDWTASGALPSGSVEATVMQEIAKSLEGSGVELQMYHAEAAPGQYEVVTGPLTPLESADALVLTRETIVNVAAKHGLRATFAPRVYTTSVGSAAHTNISVHSPRSPKTNAELSSYESSFLASLMENLPALPALTLPTPASYKRMADGVWSGGTYVNWGTENREAPIRLSSRANPSGRRFEMRYVDATANPYLVLAGILSIGHAGIESQQKLVVQDVIGPKAAAQMTEEERQALGITQRLPLNWDEARLSFEKNQLIRKVFGEEFVTKYLSVNKTLREALDLDKDETAAVARLVKFY